MRLYHVLESAESEAFTVSDYTTQPIRWEETSNPLFKLLFQLDRDTFPVYATEFLSTFFDLVSGLLCWVGSPGEGTGLYTMHHAKRIELIILEEGPYKMLEDHARDYVLEYYKSITENINPQTMIPEPEIDRFLKD